MESKQRRWLGGYVRWGKKGPSFVIERWIDGHRHHVSTKCRTERAALAQLAEFEADPANYKPNRVRAKPVGVRRVLITADLIDEYRTWMISRRDAPATDVHAAKHENRLIRWMKFYRGRDVRTVPLREVVTMLEDGKDTMMRVQALKSFFRWMRTKKFLLDRTEDPTLDLAGPPRRAAKDSKKVVIEPDRILKILPYLPQRSRDVLILRLGTAWHGSEVERFAKTGTIVRTPGKFISLVRDDGVDKVPLLAVLRVKQKVGVMTNTPILYEEHLAAAERIQERRYVPNQLTMNRHVTAACEEAGVERFLNWHLRHSVISNAIESGADAEQVAPFVDHFNAKTTRRHYIQIALPKKAVPVVRVPDLRIIPGGKKSVS